MSLQEVLVILGLVATPLASYGAARYAGRSSVKVKKIDIDAAAYARAEEINKGLFANLRQQITDLQNDIKRIDGELEEVKQQNSALVIFCYKLISIIRKSGNEADIPEPPHGIYL